jgi:hypothetical protein
MPWAATLVIRRADGSEVVHDLPPIDSPRWRDGISVGMDVRSHVVVSDPLLAPEHFRIFWAGHHQLLRVLAPTQQLLGNGLERRSLPLGEISRVDGCWFEAGGHTFKVGSRKMRPDEDTSKFNRDFDLRDVHVIPANSRRSRIVVIAVLASAIALLIFFLVV